MTFRSGAGIFAQPANFEHPRVLSRLHAIVTIVRFHQFLIDWVTLSVPSATVGIVV